MNESQLKTQLGKEFKTLLPDAIFRRHEDRFVAGGPDISVTWNKHTTWLEVKHAHPGIRHRDVQDIECLKLAKQGRCWYIIYHDNGPRKVLETRIVHPAQIHLGTWRELDVKFQREGYQWQAQGFSHALTVNFIRATHI